MKQAPYGEEGVDLSCDWVIGLALNGPKQGHFGVPSALHTHARMHRVETVNAHDRFGNTLQKLLVLAALRKQEVSYLHDQRKKNTIESPFCRSDSAHKPCIRL